MRAVIKGTGMHLPANVVDNHRFSRLMETTDEWIRQRTGIVTRRFADRHEATSDLAVPAAENALSDAGVGKEAVDYVVFATMTPDYYFPGSGPIFTNKLGLKDVPCLDIRQQCTGFLYGLQVADALIRSGQHRNVLVVGAEVHACFLPWEFWATLFAEEAGPVTDEEKERYTRFRDRAVLFGDGAGAFLVSGEQDDTRGLEDVSVHADGAYYDKMLVKGGGSAFRPYFDPSRADSGDFVPVIEGREVFRMAVTVMPASVHAILKRNGYAIEDLDLLIMHQANLRINETVQKNLGLSDERVYNNIQKYGNTTAATLPIAFHEARRERNLESGSLVCFVALGSGLTWGAALYRC